MADDDIYSMFESDPTAETEGVWVTFGASRFRVRSITSPAVSKVLVGQAQRQSRIRQANNGLLPDQLVQQNEVDIASAVVTDWENVAHPDPEQRAQGVMLDFSPANQKLLFGNPRLHRLRTAILNEAQTFENYRRANQAALEGNSATASAGSLSEALQPAS
jgi:hypothetical protein